MQQNIIIMAVVALVLATMALIMQNKKNKTAGQSFNLVLAALLVAVSIVLAQFRFYIPLFGFPSVRFSVSEIPIFIVGALFGGLYGAMSGFASDIISFILAPSGAYHFGFTLNLMLVGFVPGIIFKQIRDGKLSIAFDLLNKILGSVALVGALIYINSIGLKEMDEVRKIGPFPVNVVLSVIMILIVGALSYGTYKLKKNYAGNEGLYSIDQLVFVMCVNYIIINLCLTPLWLLQLYNIPIMASVTVRIFKSLIDVPLQVIVLYTVIHAIPVRMRERLS